MSECVCERVSEWVSDCEWVSEWVSVWVCVFIWNGKYSAYLELDEKRFRRNRKLRIQIEFQHARMNNFLQIQMA